MTPQNMLQRNYGYLYIMFSHIYLRGEILRVEYPDGDWFIGKVIDFAAWAMVLEDLKDAKMWPAFENTKITKLLSQ